MHPRALVHAFYGAPRKIRVVALKRYEAKNSNSMRDRKREDESENGVV